MKQMVVHSVPLPSPLRAFNYSTILTKVYSGTLSGNLPQDYSYIEVFDRLYCSYDC